MKFSILVPMYNVEEFLAGTIKSVLEQTYQNFELILVNDGSTDKTLSIADKFSDLDKRITLIDQSNSGLVQTRRRAIKLAKGDYILILDSDDFLNRNALEILKATIDNQNSDLILFKYNNVDMNNKIWKRQKHPLTNIEYDRNLILQLFLLNYSMHHIWAKCFKANLLKDDFIDYDGVGHLNMNEDRLQSIYGLFHAKKIYFLDEYLYNYRTNPNSLTLKFNVKGIYDSIRAYDTIYNYYYDKFDVIIINELLKGDTMQTIGKFYRWISTNSISKKEKNELIDYLINSKVFERSKKLKFNLKDKFIYNSIVKKKYFRINLIKYLNTRRIKNQRTI